MYEYNFLIASVIRVASVIRAFIFYIVSPRRTSIFELVFELSVIKVPEYSLDYNDSSPSKNSKKVATNTIACDEMANNYQKVATHRIVSDNTS